jgi:hypothetical protein
MHIEKLDENCFYYTDIISEEEKEFLLSTSEKPDGWFKIYDRGQKYDSSRDPENESNQNVMIAARKEFLKHDYPELNNLLKKAFDEVLDNYCKEKNINVQKRFDGWTSIDKHYPGTVYKTHIDTTPVDLETYSILFYLNDDYEGGEISFSLPTPGKKVEVVNGNLAEGPNGLYPPDHEKNKDLVSFWLKPKACSMLIFPPLRPHIYPHTAHEIRSGEKYLIKGHWQIEQVVSTNFVNDPYVNQDGTRISDQDLKHINPGAKIEGIVPDEYKRFHI